MLVLLLHFLLVEALVLASPVVHPQGRQQVSLLPPVAPEGVPVQRPEHLLFGREDVLEGTVGVVAQVVQSRFLEGVVLVPVVLDLDNPCPLEVVILCQRGILAGA